MNTISDILIIDDDIVCHLLLKTGISYANLQDNIATFLNGKEALDYLDHEGEENGKLLIFLDINMPVMNGWEFLDELQKKQYREKIIVVITSTSVRIADKQKAFQYPQVISYHEKPINAPVINNLIEKLSTSFSFSEDLVKLH